MTPDVSGITRYGCWRCGKRYEMDWYDEALKAFVCPHCGDVLTMAQALRFLGHGDHKCEGCKDEKKADPPKETGHIFGPGVWKSILPLEDRVRFAYI
uniref:Uncharacterized protein n=1 Tax=viral metagenome TaxID=1070528 RepID=A0A6M3L3U3_9ZZZZ